MAPTYAIGDIQGCFATFERLLDVIGFSPSRDRLWLAGDLVNRGPASLSVLRWAMSHEDCVTAVLGNHDFHLLATAEGLSRKRGFDTFDEILSALDKKKVIDWLRACPILYSEDEFMLVHAGFLPQWSATEATDLACEVEEALREETYHQFLSELYGDIPTNWQSDLKGNRRLRAIVNAMTRMRVITGSGEMDLKFSGPPSKAPPGTFPWDEAPGRKTRDKIVVCGHWASRGLEIKKNLLSIDTGCVWGGKLTAVRLENMAVFQVASREISK